MGKMSNPEKISGVNKEIYLLVTEFRGRHYIQILSKTGRPPLGMKEDIPLYKIKMDCYDEVAKIIEEDTYYRDLTREEFDKAITRAVGSDRIIPLDSQVLN